MLTLIYSMIMDSLAFDKEKREEAERVLSWPDEAEERHQASADAAARRTATSLGVDPDELVRRAAQQRAMAIEARARVEGGA